MFPHWHPSIGFISKATKHWTHFKGHQTWNIPRATKLGTFHCSSSWDLPLFPCFLFSLKAQIWIIVIHFSNVIFDLNFWKLVPTIFLGRRKVINS
jgi:hypothetical protein